MKAGRLRHRVSIINARTTARSAEGAPIITFSTVIETWADVEPLSGSEMFRQNYRYSEADTKFTIRYSTFDIAPKMDLVFNGSTYNILSVVDSSNAHRELVLLTVKTT